jgi:GNAT superfamily N-acetyltransferase
MTRFASITDCAVLAAMNHRLIQDEGHRNPMTIPELEQRMHGWLSSGEYRAVVSERESQPLAYALYRIEADSNIYLRQFFVAHEYRRQGIGRATFETLLRNIWPPDARVTVEVLSQNESGRRFWSAVGFHDYAVTLERLSTTSETPSLSSQT